MSSAKNIKQTLLTFASDVLLRKNAKILANKFQKIHIE